VSDEPLEPPSLTSEDGWLPPHPAASSAALTTIVLTWFDR
jgi:hypothetical protein